VARGVHYVPGLDASLRFTAAAPGERVTMAWDSVYVVAPAVAQQQLHIDAGRTATRLRSHW
jgi:hypothetical protein